MRLQAPLQPIQGGKSSYRFVGLVADGGHGKIATSRWWGIVASDDRQSTIQMLMSISMSIRPTCTSVLYIVFHRPHNSPHAALDSIFLGVAITTLHLHHHHGWTSSVCGVVL